MVEAVLRTLCGCTQRRTLPDKSPPPLIEFPLESSFRVLYGHEDPIKPEALKRRRFEYIRSHEQFDREGNRVGTLTEYREVIE